MVKGMVPSVERTATALIDSFIDKGSCDFVADFAFPLPGIVIAEQIGLDANEINTFKRWSDAMLSPAQGLLVDEDSAKHYSEIEAEAQHFFAPTARSAHGESRPGTSCRRSSPSLPRATRR